MTAPSPEALARVATAAIAMVEPKMSVGLGTGRAAEAFIRRLGQAVNDGLEVIAVTTSNRSETLAQELGIPLGTVESVPKLHVAFDGADEVDPNLQLTKGLGGALLRERVVASLAERFVVLVTPEKMVTSIGSRTPIPVEVVPFAQPVVLRRMLALGHRPVVRVDQQAQPYRTDNMNAIVDVHVDATSDPNKLHRSLRSLVGVVDTGLFLDMATDVLVGHSERVEHLRAAIK